MVWKKQSHYVEFMLYIHRDHENISLSKDFNRAIGFVFKRSRNCDHAASCLLLAF